MRLLNGRVVAGENVADCNVDLRKHIVLLVDLRELLIDERRLRGAHLFVVSEFRRVGRDAGRIALLEDVDALCENRLVDLYSLLLYGRRSACASRLLIADGHRDRVLRRRAQLERHKTRRKQARNAASRMLTAPPIGITVKDTNAS